MNDLDLIKAITGTVDIGENNDSCLPRYKQELSHSSTADVPVLAEIPIRSTELHNIANGKVCTIGYKGELFAVRFLLTNSFKVKSSNFVVNNLLMQILPVSKQNAMRKEDMAVLTKVKTVDRKVKVKPEKEAPKFEVKESDKEIW